MTNPNNSAFNFQSAADEGDVIQVGIQATNTQTLRISNINLTVSSASAPTIGAEDAIGQVDHALETLLTQWAQLGAVIVCLNEDANNDSVTAVNLQASESSTRDLSVGQAPTEFYKVANSRSGRNIGIGPVKRERGFGFAPLPLVGYEPMLRPVCLVSRVTVRTDGPLRYCGVSTSP